MSLDKNLIEMVIEHANRPDFYKLVRSAIQELKKVQFNFQIGACFVRQAMIMESTQNPDLSDLEYLERCSVVGFVKNKVFVESVRSLVVLRAFWMSVEESKKIKPNLRGI
jgi:hypothetical protein